jgi:hypothetical protein
MAAGALRRLAQSGCTSFDDEIKTLFVSCRFANIFQTSKSTYSSAIIEPPRITSNPIALGIPIQEVSSIRVGSSEHSSRNGYSDCSPLAQRVGLISPNKTVLRQIMIPMHSTVHVIAHIASYDKSSEFGVLLVGMQIGEEGVGPLVCLACKSSRLGSALTNEWWDSVFAHVVALSEVKNAELGSDAKRFLSSISSIPKRGNGYITYHEAIVHFEMSIGAFLQ